MFSKLSFLFKAPCIDQNILDKTLNLYRLNIIYKHKKDAAKNEQINVIYI